MGSRGLAKLLSLAGLAPTLASMGGCEPPVCSIFGEQIQAEGCGESSKLNSAPEIVEVSVPHATKPGQLRDYQVRAKDPDKDDLYVEWDFDGDGDYEVAGPPDRYQPEFAESRKSWKYPRLGTYTLRVRISDYPELPGGEGVTIVERRIRVATQAEFDANREPVAQLTLQEPVVAGTEAELDASGSSDPDGDRLTYEFWYETEDGETDRTLESGSSKVQVRFPPEENQRTIGVRVYDEFGDHDAVQKYVWGYDRRRVPRAAIDATPSHVRTGRAVIFDASRTLIGGSGGGASYEWDLDGEQGYELNTGGVDHAMRSYDTPGHRTARVRVTNHLGFTDFATADVYVGDGPHAVLATEPATPCVGQSVAFSADGSTDPDNDIVRYQWDVDDVAGFERDSTEPRAEHTYYTAGTHFVSVRVTDATGNMDTATLELQVDDCGDTPPSAALHADPYPATVGQEVVFSATQATPSIVRYYWDLDGVQGYEQETTVAEAVHTYSAVGEYVLRLRVVDGAGRDYVAGLTLPVQPLLQQFGRVYGGLPRWLAPRATVAASRRVPPRPFSAELRDTRAESTIADRLGGVGRARVWLGRTAPLTRAERSMRRLLRARWRTGLRFATRGGGRATVHGLVLAEPAARGRRSRACARVALDLRAGRLPRGKLTILGGSGAAASLRGTATFRFRVDPTGRVTIVGSVRARLGKPRALPRTCRALS